MTTTAPSPQTELTANELGVNEPSAPDQAEKRCLECLRCKALRDSVGPGAPSWAHIPELLAPAELHKYPGLENAKGPHSAEPDGILAWYDFHDEVKCSFPGHHLHRHGIVVKTLCGLVLCMGMQCGRKSIVGFDAIHKAVEARVQFEKNLGYLNNWAQDFRTRIALLRVPLDARHSLRGLIEGSLPELFAVLRGRAVQGGRGREVSMRSRYASRSEEQEDRIEQLRGLELFQNRTPTHGALQESLADFERAYREHPPADGFYAAALVNVARKAEERLDHAEEWLRETSQFLTEGNLWVALAALDRDAPAVAAEANGFCVRYMPGRSALLRLPDVPSGRS